MNNRDKPTQAGKARLQPSIRRRDKASPGAGHAELIRLVQLFQGRRVLVHGDLIVDEFVITGEPRVSREAPVLILKYKQRRMVAGGAANAAANIASLGGKPVIVGEVGDDGAGKRLIELLDEIGADTSGISVHAGGRTPRKTRYLASDRNVALQQVVRVDRIEPFDRTPDFWASAKEKARAALARADGVLVSDYGLGFVTPEVITELYLQEPTRARYLVSLDSRHRLFEYAGIDIATPSESELEEALGRSIDGADAIELGGREALTRLGAKSLIVTRGSMGMMIFEPDESTESVPAFGSGTVADVTGAGDTVIAALSLALAAGATAAQAARLANAAAGIAVTKLGTATVAAFELIEELQRS